MRAKVIHTYLPNGSDAASQLSLAAGDTVYVLDKDESGWWAGFKEGDNVTGWFPAGVVLPMAQQAQLEQQFHFVYQQPKLQQQQQPFLMLQHQPQQPLQQQPQVQVKVQQQPPPQQPQLPPKQQQQQLPQQLQQSQHQQGDPRCPNSERSSTTAATTTSGDGCGAFATQGAVSSCTAPTSVTTSYAPEPVASNDLQGTAGVEAQRPTTCMSWAPGVTYTTSLEEPAGQRLLAGVPCTAVAPCAVATTCSQGRYQQSTGQGSQQIAQPAGVAEKVGPSPTATPTSSYRSVATASGAHTQGQTVLPPTVSPEALVPKVPQGTAAAVASPPPPVGTVAPKREGGGTAQQAGACPSPGTTHSQGQSQGQGQGGASAGTATAVVTKDGRRVATPMCLAGKSGAPSGPVQQMPASGRVEGSVATSAYSNSQPSVAAAAPASMASGATSAVVSAKEDPKKTGPTASASWSNQSSQRSSTPVPQERISPMTSYRETVKAQIISAAPNRQQPRGTASKTCSSTGSATELSQRSASPMVGCRPASSSQTFGKEAAARKILSPVKVQGSRQAGGTLSREGARRNTAMSTGGMSRRLTTASNASTSSGREGPGPKVPTAYGAAKGSARRAVATVSRQLMPQTPVPSARELELQLQMVAQQQERMQEELQYLRQDGGMERQLLRLEQMSTQQCRLEEELRVLREGAASEGERQQVQVMKEELEWLHEEMGKTGLRLRALESLSNISCAGTEVSTPRPGKSASTVRELIAAFETRRGPAPQTLPPQSSAEASPPAAESQQPPAARQAAACRG